MLRSAVTIASRMMRLAGASSRTAIAFYRPVAAAPAPVETIRPPLFGDSIRHKFSKAKYPTNDYDDDDKDYSEPDDEPLDGFHSEESDFEGFYDKDDDKDDGKNKKYSKDDGKNKYSQ